MAAVDQEDIDAVKSLKAAEDLISTSLKNDFLLLQDKHTALSTDFDEQKNHLVEALLSKDRLMQDLAASKDKSGDDPDGQARAQAMIDEEKAQREVSLHFMLPQQHRDLVAPPVSIIIIITNYTLRHGLTPSQQIQKQDALIDDLQRKLKEAEESGPDAQKVLFSDIPLVTDNSSLQSGFSRYLCRPRIVCSSFPVYALSKFDLLVAID